MRQLFMIHGGMTFKSRKDYHHWLKTRKLSIKKKEKWTGKYLEQKLGKKFHIIKPRMPLQDNAKYEDWKIHFKRYIPKMKNNLVLMGGSLGGIFLAKYLSENRFPKKIKALYLICPPYDNTLTGEDLVGGFALPKSLKRLEKCTKKLTLLFSEDDDVVPPSHAFKYLAKLKSAKIIMYESKNGHFNISEFPEMIKMLKEDL